MTVVPLTHSRAITKSPKVPFFGCLKKKKKKNLLNTFLYYLYSLSPLHASLLPFHSLAPAFSHPVAAREACVVSMPPVFTGKDDRGNSIGNNLTFWKAVKEGAKAPDGKPLWYKKGIEYWDAVAATDDGVLGGYGHVSTQDALDNTAFLEAVFGDALEAKKTGSRRLVACDCGAGIGRVTSSFLIHQFDEVDLVVRVFSLSLSPSLRTRTSLSPPIHIATLCAPRSFTCVRVC